ncbi:MULTISPECIES: bile acid:sodium symporter family protein [unclassified Luteococcus]|uniref:bile acid:sodium symporter family protein n=1 Tax=unclassified Luteococcus TaxID=2639923 RepID=UPI00313AAB33
MNLRLPKPDYFLLAIIAAAVVASIAPATGALVPVVSWASKIMIAILFFLYGARLSPNEALEGLKHWRLHSVILAFTYLLFPVIGLAMWLLVPTVLSPELYRGMLWLTLVPSTVQSSINFTSIARGNVAGAIVSASFSNLIGVVVTPVLALLLMSTSGGLTIDASSVLDIVVQLLVPFALGQLSRRWTADFVKRHKKLKLVDQGSIVLVVYSAFSAGMRDHMWTKVDVLDIVKLVVVCSILLALMLWLTWHVARWLRFNRADAIAIQFCGTKKSLATGVPMATVLFAQLPDVGLLVLPLMVFHQLQLMACSAMAGRYARQAPDTPLVDA